MYINKDIYIYLKIKRNILKNGLVIYKIYHC